MLRSEYATVRERKREKRRRGDALERNERGDLERESGAVRRRRGGSVVGFMRCSVPVVVMRGNE